MYNPPWWGGGVAGACCQLLTAPFDLLETRLVVDKEKRGLIKNMQWAIRKHGFFSLYDGVSAQILRQLTYTTMRFHLYQLGKQRFDDSRYFQKCILATFSGSIASSIGIPIELVNTRMHIDRTLPKDERWNYRHAFHGLYRVCRDEGFLALYKGGLFSIIRSSLSTIGQIASYDQAKEFYMRSFDFKHDQKLLHVISSVTAAIIYGPLIQPIENIRTLQMTHPGGMSDYVRHLLDFGTRGLFRGLVPCLLRSVPNTIIMFLLFEEFRVRFGNRK
ncbi:mitochondrial dicarboxylate carrier [Drosophila bipectinata]|uniref:mitochondrial dicarboxylate carrier n=1 Tax=Drosophila bipectinata TaxID=42026 RepID=UPI001C893E51|nr:mitochondrial dicarboxylate carrier [Drosophila bipectinata]